MHLKSERCVPYCGSPRNDEGGAVSRNFEIVRQTLATKYSDEGGARKFKLRQYVDIFSHLHRQRRFSQLKWREQPEGDLGRRMASTIAAAFEEGHDACVIVGADIPGIGVAHVRPALEALSQGRDMVLGPAEDGGYYLVGVAKSPDMTRDRLSRVFCPDAPVIEWGTSAVLQQQVIDMCPTCKVKLQIGNFCQWNNTLFYSLIPE